jgi:hypothetical protein
MLFYFDESIRSQFLGLGFIAFDFNEFGKIRNSLEQLKTSFGIDIETPLKYTLGDNNKIEKKAKDVFRQNLGDNWKYSYRKQASTCFSNLPLYFTASLHEDVRRVKLKKVSCLDFYCKALEWLLQRCYDISFKVKSNQQNVVIIDNPPRTGAVLDLKKINSVYIGAYNSYLKNINFIDSLLVASTNSSIILQLADFYIGALVDFLKYCHNKQHKYSPEYIKLLKRNFYPFSDRDSMLGIKIYALSSEIASSFRAEAAK